MPCRKCVPCGCLFTLELGRGEPIDIAVSANDFFFRTIVLRTLALCKRKFAHFHWLTAGISKATTKQVFLTHSLPRRRVGSCRHAFERQQLFRPCFHVASLRLEAMYVGLVHQCRVAKLPLLQFFFFFFSCHYPPCFRRFPSAVCSSQFVKK